MNTIAVLRAHWPEYLMEAWALGTFMLSAATVAMLVDASDAPLRQLVSDPDLRRAVTGIAMGLTAIAIIHSPWGKRSGAHMNPAVTLTFLLLKRVTPTDASFYVLAQLAGGVLGVLLASALFGAPFRDAPVSYVQTLPGPAGVLPAFAFEVLMSFGLMSLILAFTASDRLAPLTGVAAGLTVATYITIEAPFSGMSINPARTFASALPAGALDHLWLYFTAPPLGMLLAAAVRRSRRPHCAKLVHTERERCIHCGYQPPAALPASTQTSGDHSS